ncbi:MAG: Fe-S protein assembly co-chaperone HscB [Actinomycetota bacterium]
MTDQLVNINSGPAKTARDGHSLCWSCKTEVGDDPHCPHCVKLQPLGKSSDYFSVMGLPRKLSIDPRVLEPVFHALSRRFHPDMYRLSPPRERMIALENSAVLNQAYRTLRDPFDRAAYLLELEYGRETERRDSPPQDLFEEILEIQELLGDFRLADVGERTALRTQLQSKRDELLAEHGRRERELTENLFAQWDALIDGTSAPAMEQKAPLLDAMRRIIGERGYLRRVLNGINEALASPE